MGSLGDHESLPILLQPCQQEHLCQPEHQRWRPLSCVTSVMCLGGHACGQWSAPG